LVGLGSGDQKTKLGPNLEALGQGLEEEGAKLQVSMQQQPSPTLSSPSTGFMGPRSSPLFSSAVDQPDPPPPPSGQDTVRPNSTAAGQEGDQAPPKRLANALEGLGRAIRHIADVRSGADLLLEALDSAAQVRGHETGTKKASDGIQKAADTMRKALDDLRATGKELEAAGVLVGAQQKFEDKGLWNLQVPFVAPDGALVPYAWKRQIAGQAAASAYDRARIALKAFTEQKRRYFPSLEVTTSENGPKAGTKRSRTEGSESTDTSVSSLPDILRRIQSEAPGMTVTPYARLAWTSKFGSQGGAISGPVNKMLSKYASLQLKNSAGTAPPAVVDSPAPSKHVEKVAVLEVSIPEVLVAVISVLPAGSIYPDAVAIFSPAETGGHIQAWGISHHKLHQRLSDYAVMTLHHFLQQDSSSALELLLRWLYLYKTLYTQPCLSCKHLMALDAPSDLLFPPLVRLPSRQPPLSSNTKSAPNTKPEDPDTQGDVMAYHLGCAPIEFF